MTPRFMRGIYLFSLLLLALFVAPALPGMVAFMAAGQPHDHRAAYALDRGRTAATTYGPYVGGVTDSSAVVWMKLNNANEVTVNYSVNADMTDSMASPTIVISPELDHTAHIPLADLQPATTYYFDVNGDEPIYHFKTFPLPDQPAEFSFIAFADASSLVSRDADAYVTAATLENPAFALQIGDFRHFDPTSVEPVDIGTWRINNRKCLRDSDAGDQFADYIGGQATGLAIPFVHIWDDHDYAENDGDRFLDSQYKAWAKQAFLEYFPTYPLANPDNGLWHSFRYGQAEVFVLDLRTQRDDMNEPDDPTKSILDGGRLAATGQKQWLKDGLLNSTAEWKFIVSSSVFSPAVKSRDSWQNFNTEQQELVNFINDNNVTGVIVLSADLHSAGAIDDGTNAFFPELSVPHTNLKSFRCTTGGNGCGVWSQGVTQPTASEGGGYALVTVSAAGSVTLTTKDEDGNVRLSYTVVRDW